MIDTISISGKEYRLTPMNASEATEVMFILGKYAEDLTLKREPLKKIARLIEKISEKDPADMFRLLAYMLHIDAEELIKPDLKSSELLVALTDCLTINMMPVLINLAYRLGIAKAPWETKDGIPITE